MGMRQWQWGLHRAIGLDVADDRITAVELLRTRAGRVAVAAVGHEPLPPGSVVAGRVQHPDTVSALLVGLMRRCRMKATSVAMGLPAREVTVRRSRLPAALPEGEREHLAIDEAREVSAGWGQELVFDCSVVGIPADAPAEVEVQVAATHAEGLKERVQLAHSAGLEPVVVEVLSHACWRAVRHGHPHLVGGTDTKGPQGTVAVVECRAIGWGISVFVGDELALEREPQASADPPALNPQADSPRAVRAAAHAIARQLGVAAASITGGRLGGVVLCGPSELLPLAVELTEVMSMPVTVIDPLAGLEVWESADLTVSFEASAPVAAKTRALGLALRGLES